MSHLEAFVDSPEWGNDHGQVGHGVPELGDVPAHLYGTVIASGDKTKFILMGIANSSQNEMRE